MTPRKTGFLEEKEPFLGYGIESLEQGELCGPGARKEEVETKAKLAENGELSGTSSASWHEKRRRVLRRTGPKDTRVPRPGKEPPQFKNTKLSPGRLHNFWSVSRPVRKAGPQSLHLWRLRIQGVLPR